MKTVAKRLSEVRRRIAEAAKSAGREPETVRLVAVSKHQPTALIREAYDAGQRDFGESYAQELERKADELSDLPDIRFHMIGRLQRNKARHVVRVASAVHTVDSLRLAAELGRRARETPSAPAVRWPVGGRSDTRLPVFVEVNVGGESQKGGCEPDVVADLLSAVDSEPALHLAGLMTVPPHTEDPAGALPFFEELARLRQQHGGAVRLPELSMGMSHDLEYAVLAGATVVRIGTAIFGERP